MDYDHNPYRASQELARMEEAAAQMRGGDNRVHHESPLEEAIRRLKIEMRTFTANRIHDGFEDMRQQMQLLIKKYSKRPPPPHSHKDDDCWDHCGHPPPKAEDCEDQLYWMARLGTRRADVAANNIIELVLTPTNVEEFVPRQFLVAAFDTGTSTPNLNGSIEAVSIKGDNQLAGGSIAFSEFDRNMPFLRVNWRAATPQNPIVIRLQHHNTTTNADIQVVVAGDAKK